MYDHQQCFDKRYHRGLSRWYDRHLRQYIRQYLDMNQSKHRPSIQNHSMDKSRQHREELTSVQTIISTNWTQIRHDRQRWTSRLDRYRTDELDKIFIEHSFPTLGSAWHMPLGHFPVHGLTEKSTPSMDPSVVVLSRTAVIGISVAPGVGSGISTGVDLICISI